MFHRVPNTPLDTNLSVFQYKKLYNVLLLNRILFKFAEMEPCYDPIWNAANETPIHLLHESIFFMNPSSSWIKHSRISQSKLPHFFGSSSIISVITSVDFFFSFLSPDKMYLLLNLLLLLFKLFMFTRPELLINSV